MDKDERMRLEEEGLKKTNGRIKMKEDKSRKRRNNGIRWMEEEDGKIIEDGCLKKMDGGRRMEWRRSMDE